MIYFLKNQFVEKKYFFEQEDLIFREIFFLIRNKLFGTNSKFFEPTSSANQWTLTEKDHNRTK